jgi:hypothetical protein
MTGRTGLGRAFAAAVGDWPATSKRVPAADVPGEASVPPADLRAPDAAPAEPDEVDRG